jgi:hypothetical protein
MKPGIEQNPMQQLGLGAPHQMDGDDDEHTNSDDPRGQEEEVSHHVVETTK